MLAKSPQTLPAVHVRDGEVYANSKDVADYFERKHDDVLRAIRNALGDLAGASPQFCGNAFIPTTYRAAIGSGAFRDFPAYDMTRDGFVCMHSRTEKAAEVRKRLITVFIEYRHGRLTAPTQPAV